MGDKKESSVIITLVSIILMLLLSGYYTYNELLKNNSANNCQINNYKKFAENAKTERTDEDLKNLSNYRIKITILGDVYVNSQLVEKNVLKAVEVYSSKSDVCNGNNRLVFIKEDGTITALDLDMLECTNEIKMITDFDKLKDVIKVYYKETKPSNGNEPATYSVYAIDIKRSVTEITEYLK